MVVGSSSKIADCDETSVVVAVAVVAAAADASNTPAAVDISSYHSIHFSILLWSLRRRKGTVKVPGYV